MPFLNAEGHPFCCYQPLFQPPKLSHPLFISLVYQPQLRFIKTLILIRQNPISYPSKPHLFSLVCLSFASCNALVMPLVSKSIDIAHYKQSFYTLKSMLLPHNSIAFSCSTHIVSATTTLPSPCCCTPINKRMILCSGAKKKQ